MNYGELEEAILLSNRFLVWLKSELRQHAEANKKKRNRGNAYVKARNRKDVGKDSWELTK